MRRANPKSRTLARPSGVTTMFAALQVAMCHAVAMCVRQRVRNLHPVPPDVVDRQAA